MWDTKRQIIWLAAGLLFGSVFLYPLARDDAGATDWSYFAQLELLLLLVVAVMFYVYSRKKN
jgi:cell division protein FtsW (lipid II flippase)